MCYNLGVAEQTKFLTPSEQANTYSFSRDGFTTNTGGYEIYGALYQWGRHTDGHQLRTSLSYTGPSLNSTNYDTNGQVIDNFYAIRFLHNGTSPYDWRYNTGQINTLWNSGTPQAPVKTVNDPCPPGWRVPTYDEWNSITGTYNSREFRHANAGGTGGLLLTPAGVSVPTLFLPAGGFREYNYVSAQFRDPGYFGSYWSSRTEGINANYLTFSVTLSTLNMANQFRAYGSAVRCVSEH
jgi:uncharacterized protein (TIGR02145 family)